MLKADPKLWQPQLAYLISRHANHLDRWQLGADGSDTFVTDPKMRRAYGRVYQEFAKLVEKPDLAMPWPAWYEPDGELPATVALSVSPQVVLPHQVPLYVQDSDPEAGGLPARAAAARRLRHRPGLRQPYADSGGLSSLASAEHNLSLSLQWLDRDRYGREAQIRDLAQRVVYALSADARRIDLPLPFTVRSGGGRDGFQGAAGTAAGPAHADYDAGRGDV